MPNQAEIHARERADRALRGGRPTRGAGSLLAASVGGEGRSGALRSLAGGRRHRVPGAGAHARGGLRVARVAPLRRGAALLPAGRAAAGVGAGGVTTGASRRRRAPAVRARPPGAGRHRAGGGRCQRGGPPRVGAGAARSAAGRAPLRDGAGAFQSGRGAAAHRRSGGRRATVLDGAAPAGGGRRRVRDARRDGARVRLLQRAAAAGKGHGLVRERLRGVPQRDPGRGGAGGSLPGHPVPRRFPELRGREGRVARGGHGRAAGRRLQPARRSALRSALPDAGHRGLEAGGARERVRRAVPSI